ncbi:MAG: hypothetical protein FWD86_03380, partial [Firmicutes bacterium]|nr:hypothetical protein [Bacillota bacterium]
MSTENFFLTLTSFLIILAVVYFAYILVSLKQTGGKKQISAQKQHEKVVFFMALVLNLAAYGFAFIWVFAVEDSYKIKFSDIALLFTASLLAFLIAVAAGIM